MRFKDKSTLDLKFLTINFCLNKVFIWFLIPAIPDITTDCTLAVLGRGEGDGEGAPYREYV